MTELRGQVTSVLRNVWGRKTRAQPRFACCGRSPTVPLLFCCGRSPTEPLRPTGTVSDAQPALRNRETCGQSQCGDPRTTAEPVRGQETRAQPQRGQETRAQLWSTRAQLQVRTQHGISEIPANPGADDLTLRLRELETLDPLPKTLHKFPACFQNSSFGLDARCRLCIVSPMKC
jgi:hypothetical protein